MNRRRAARSGNTPSTLSTLPLPVHAREAGLELPDAGTSRKRRLRRLMFRLGALRFTALLTLIAIAASVGITLLSNVIYPPPPSMVRFTLILSAIIPALVAPPVAWFAVLLMFEAEDARRIAERLAVTDPLTQAFNRRHFFHIGEREFAASQRAREALSVLLLDIDNFKAVNDQHGHAVGDRVLKEVAQTCMDGMREHDLLARFGGEEFVVLLPATDLVEAATVAERLRQSVAALAVGGDGAAVIHPTVSIGVATVSVTATSLDSLLASADHAMYLAKRSGRNRVITEAAPA